MNKLIILGIAAAISAGCNGAAQQTTTTNANVAVNASTVQTTTSNQAIVSSHSNDAEKTVTPSGNAPAGESPMAQPIDVAAMTADIEKAERAYQKNPKTKNELARAYFVRATALTGAAQYRAALGDYRKGLKLDPTDESAKTMHDRIIGVFKQLNREPPKEGEESAPLPVK